tara:strand:+ start:561 stop:1067 length:507 start_codon:yes stop_codon:yes gene_type:complete
MRAKQKTLASKFNYFCFSKLTISLTFFLILECFINVKANSVIKRRDLRLSTQDNILKEYKQTSLSNTDPRLSDLFEDAYFRYSRPMEKSTGLASQIGEFFSISIGGRSKPKTLVIGSKTDTMRWESIAIENLYRKTLLPQRKILKFNNSDIESQFCSSILTDECTPLD